MAIELLNKLSESRSKTDSTAADLIRRAEMKLTKLDGREPLKAVNVRPRKRLSIEDQPIEATPVRGVVWGRYGAPLKNDLGNWCDGDGYFATHHLTTLTLINDMGCLMNAQLHADAMRFITWSEEVGDALVDANDHLKALAVVCDPAVSPDPAAAGSTCNQKVAEFRAEARSVVSDVVELSVAMKASSLFWATSQVPIMADSDIVATFLQSYAVLTAELSNQMQSRGDALLKQFTHHRSVQPTSVYLRNTDPTDFANLYVWNRPFKLFAYDLATNGSAETRLVGVERLYGDHNWSKVNTVFANGQGDVGMAFIKDDIGNWNLKSFENDPSALLDAYTDVGKALIKTAATAAGGGGLGAVSNLLGIGGPIGDQQLKQIENNVSSGRRIAFGGGPALPNAESAHPDLIKDLRATTVKEFDALKVRVTAAQEAVEAKKTESAAKPASGSIAFERLPVGADTVTINGEQFEFAAGDVSAAERANKVARGNSRTDAVNNLIAAIAKVAETRPALKLATYALAGEGTLKITAATAGKKGNDITLAAFRNAKWDVSQLTPPGKTEAPANTPSAVLTFHRQPEPDDTITIDGVRYTFGRASEANNRIVGINTSGLKETVEELRRQLTAANDPLKPETRYRVDDTEGVTLKITATPTDAAKETISLAASSNAIVTEMSGGADKEETKVDDSALVKLHLDGDRILREYQIRIETLQKLSIPPKAN